MGKEQFRSNQKTVFDVLMHTVHNKEAVVRNMSEEGYPQEQIDLMAQMFDAEIEALQNFPPNTPYQTALKIHHRSRKKRNQQFRKF